MASNCEDVSAQMMELLYGELPADARASVDAHVVGCARCRAELEGFEKTRALARRGLDEAPPARVHAAIMQAAAAQLAAQAQAQAQPAAAARRPAPPETVSFWDRLRARWAFPTLATVGAVAVFMVANRVFLNPERTLEPRPAAEAPPTASPPEPAAAADPKPQGEPPRADDDESSNDRLDRRRGPDDGAARAHHGKSAEGGDMRGAGKKMKKAEGAEPAFAEAPSAKPARRADEKAKVVDLPRENKFAPPPPPRDGAPAVRASKEADKAMAPLEEAEAQVRDSSRYSVPARKAPSRPVAASAPAPAQRLDDLLSGTAEAPRGGGTSAAGKSVLGGLAGPGSKSGGTGSGAGAAQPAPTSPRPTVNQANRSAPVAASAAPAAAPAPSPPPATTMTKSRAKQSGDIVADEAYEGAPEAGGAAKDEKKAVAKNGANDVIMQRADRLFADGRWAEAAALYRELLKRDPRNDDAERWRRRLIAAENAEVTERRNASVAQKRAAQSQEKADTESASKPAARAPAKSKAAASDAAQ